MIAKNKTLSAMCVLTFTEEAYETPDEVAAAVAEGGLGQGDFLEAVARCIALVLRPDTRGLLRPFLPGQRARCPAVRGVRVRRSGPAGVGHVLQHTNSPTRLRQHGVILCSLVMQKSLYG